MIFKHDNWKEAKHYSIVNNGMGVYTLREFANGAKRTELTLSTEEMIMFKQKLKDGGWFEYVRN